MCVPFQNPTGASLYSVTVTVDNPQGLLLLQKLVPSSMSKRENFRHSHTVLIKKTLFLTCLAHETVKNGVLT